MCPTPVKYAKLKDLTWVAERLKTVSPQDLAEELGCPHSSVKWVIDRYLTPEQKATITWKRNHRRNKDV
jgi:hypothetical protein